MKRQQLFSTGQFAKLARTTRNTLHHYDSIGLLPAVRGANNYRYYSTNQLAAVNVIHILQELGMTLDEINRLQHQRTPDNIDALLTGQIDRIDQKIAEWEDARKLLNTLRKIIHSALGVDENIITIKFLPAEPIILGGINDYSHCRDDYSALISFYEEMQKEYSDLDLNYPVWGRYDAERLKRGDWHNPSQYYFYNPGGTELRPDGLYAVGHARGGYGQCDALYRRMMAYIEKYGFEICGDGYEEYPLNELSIVDDNDYLIRVMIMVCARKKEKPEKADK